MVFFVDALWMEKHSETGQRLRRHVKYAGFQKIPHSLMIFVLPYLGLAFEEILVGFGITFVVLQGPGKQLVEFPKFLFCFQGSPPNSGQD